MKFFVPLSLTVLLLTAQLASLPLAMAASVVGVDEVKSRDSTPAESGMLTQYPRLARSASTSSDGRTGAQQERGEKGLAKRSGQTLSTIIDPPGSQSCYQEGGICRLCSNSQVVNCLKDCSGVCGPP
ncbi:hypothetical protein IE81DRAFT_345986 [Ceraceosorus guamensis]|uniref:Membrane anchor Opy2 N-terminal domain-containing protein n=1 Tax=Ceraceosorus guamensis TaxID=1522189 RepID=A0A316W7J2_9BASI|nr:hypothetical protein IE81DRAFT_345986 [Ceraceosorus guamensis]PWN44043.1 hypothetical protein IE81DRAFT_345986 [Ceraceosorus guamensis]